MILVDTSVWIEHFRSHQYELSEALANEQVLMHPLVLGELACGNFRDRAVILNLLGNLPAAPVATDSEVLAFIEGQQLMGRGIGYVDVHFLASVMLSPGARLWTLDRRLHEIAGDLGAAYTIG